MAGGGHWLASEEQGEVLMIGPTVALFAAEPTEMSNEEAPRPNTVELTFAPASAALIIEGTKGETGDSFANAGYDPDETRVPAGQPGGGQWAAAAAATPPLPLLSGGNALQPLEDRFDSSIPISDTEFFSDVAKCWEGFGEAITETVCGLWNTIWDPVTAAEGIAAGITRFSKDPGGVLNAIGRQIAEDFTGGDLRKAGKLVGLVLLSVVSPESEPEELAALLPKVEAAVAGKEVSFTAAELDAIPGMFSKLVPRANWERKL